MKKIILLLFALMATNESIAQKIRFEYDKAGNQIQRRWCTTGCSSKHSNTKHLSKIEDEDLLKFFPEDVISYYPNPVKEELFLKWKLINENKVSRIEIFNLDGKIINSINNIENINSTTISFLQFSVGVYFVSLNYINGEQKSIKIVKN